MTRQDQVINRTGVGDDNHQPLGRQAFDNKSSAPLLRGYGSRQVLNSRSASWNVNPLVIEKAGLDAEVARLSRLQMQHHETQFKLRQTIRHLSADLPRLEARLEATRKDIAIRQDTSGDK